MSESDISLEISLQAAHLAVKSTQAAEQSLLATLQVMYQLHSGLSANQSKAIRGYLSAGAVALNALGSCAVAKRFEAANRAIARDPRRTNDAVRRVLIDSGILISSHA